MLVALAMAMEQPAAYAYVITSGLIAFAALVVLAYAKAVRWFKVETSQSSAQEMEEEFFPALVPPTTLTTAICLVPAYFDCDMRFKNW